MVAFFKNCDILIKDNTLKRRVHGMRDYREGQTERLLELPYSQSDGRPALSGFNTARSTPLPSQWRWDQYTDHGSLLFGAAYAFGWELPDDFTNEGGTAWWYLRPFWHCNVSGGAFLCMKSARNVLECQRELRSNFWREKRRFAFYVDISVPFDKGFKDGSSDSAASGASGVHSSAEKRESWK